MEMQRIILATVPGLQIVGEVADWALLPAAIQQTGAHWVIVSLPSDHESSQAVEALLAAYPAIHSWQGTCSRYEVAP